MFSVKKETDTMWYSFFSFGSPMSIDFTPKSTKRMILTTSSALFSVRYEPNVYTSRLGCPSVVMRYP
jgi:hypothetical protein